MAVAFLTQRRASTAITLTNLRHSRPRRPLSFHRWKSRHRFPMPSRFRIELSSLPVGRNLSPTSSRSCGIVYLQTRRVSSCKMLEMLSQLEDTFGVTPNEDGTLSIDPKADGAKKMVQAIQASSPFMARSAHAGGKASNSPACHLQESRIPTSRKGWFMRQLTARYCLSEPWRGRGFFENRCKIDQLHSTIRFFTPHPEQAKHENGLVKMRVSSKWYYFRRFKRKIHLCNCGEWLTDAILLESFPMLSNTVYFF